MQQADAVADVFQFPEIVGGDHRREIPLYDLGGDQALYGLPHDRVQPVEGLIAEQIFRARAQAQQDGHLFLHAF